MSIPHPIDRRMTPIFSVGKKTALSSLPARYVLSKLQQPKNKPTHAAMAKLTLRIRMDGDGVRDSNANIRELPAAIRKAISKKAERCSA